MGFGEKAAERIEGLMEIGGTGKDFAFIMISAVALLLSLLGVNVAGVDTAWIAVILCGVPIAVEAIIGLTTRFDIKADVLVFVAIVAALCVGEIFVAGEVAAIMQLGGLLEDLTVARARSGIEKLVKLTPRTAKVIRNGEEIIIDASEVCVGDIVRILPGETVPADGVIESGTTSIDQSVVTGESMPVDKCPGDDVYSGTINRFGAIDVRATRRGEDSSIQRMVRLVESADAGKSKVVGVADRWATWIVVAAALAAITVYLFTGEVDRSVTVLVVFCPCALVLATPTAIMAAIGNASRHGFLVRDGGSLERLSKVTRIMFDKTGTLTHGRPEVVSVIPAEGWDRDELYSLAASAESMSEHPLGNAVSVCYRKTVRMIPVTPEEFSSVPGKGISAKVRGHIVLAGNAAMMESEGIAIPEGSAPSDDGSISIYVAADGAFAGTIVLADELREASRDTVSAVEAVGVEPVLATGDKRETAMHIAGMAGIRNVHAECLPEDKLSIVHELSKDGGVCMVGDGVNDAPSLKAADVGIAMGGIGSDIAIDAADIVAVNDGIEEIPHMLALSRKMMGAIRRNIAFAMGINLIATVLALAGLMGPVVGALVHNAGSVIVIVSSVMLLGWSRSDAQ